MDSSNCTPYWTQFPLPFTKKKKSPLEGQHPWGGANPVIGISKIGQSWEGKRKSKLSPTYPDGQTPLRHCAVTPTWHYRGSRPLLDRLASLWSTHRDRTELHQTFHLIFLPPSRRPCHIFFFFCPLLSYSHFSSILLSFNSSHKSNIVDERKKNQEN